MRKVALLVVLTLLLAGCAKPGAKSAGSVVPQDYSKLQLQSGASTGIIRGAVVDTAIKPVAGVVVSLMDTKEAVVTDAQGRFGFSNVAPGTHFLSADKTGYAPAQTSVEVVAGDASPRATILQIAYLPSAQPRVDLLEWHGFMQCSFTVGGAFGTGCLLPNSTTGDNSRRYDAIDGQPDFLQSEIQWTPTQTLGTSFCMRHYASDSIGGTVLMDDMCGNSPLTQQANATRLNKTGVGTAHGIERLAWVDGYGNHLGPGVAVNQRFDLFTSLFYNLVPRDGWSFIKDGPYPVPS